MTEREIIVNYLASSFLNYLLKNNNDWVYVKENESMEIYLPLLKVFDYNKRYFSRISNVEGIVEGNIFSGSCNIYIDYIWSSDKNTNKLIVTKNELSELQRNFVHKNYMMQKITNQKKKENKEHLEEIKKIQEEKDGMIENATKNNIDKRKKIWTKIANLAEEEIKILERVAEDR